MRLYYRLVGLGLLVLAFAALTKGSLVAQATKAPAHNLNEDAASSDLIALTGDLTIDDNFLVAGAPVPAQRSAGRVSVLPRRAARSSSSHATAHRMSPPQSAAQVRSPTKSSKESVPMQPSFRHAFFKYGLVPLEILSHKEKRRRLIAQCRDALWVVKILSKTGDDELQARLRRFDEHFRLKVRRPQWTVSVLSQAIFYENNPEVLLAKRIIDVTDLRSNAITEVVVEFLRHLKMFSAKDHGSACEAPVTVTCSTLYGGHVKRLLTELAGHGIAYDELVERSVFVVKSAQKCVGPPDANVIPQSKEDSKRAVLQDIRKCLGSLCPSEKILSQYYIADAEPRKRLLADYMAYAQKLTKMSKLKGSKEHASLLEATYMSFYALYRRIE